MYMNLFPVGTTDFNERDQSPMIQEHVDSNYKAEGTYTATQTGVLPLEFFSDAGCGNDPAPYDFTTYVRHAVRLSVPKQTSLPSSGAIPVGVHNPDGGAITDSSLVVGIQLKSGNQPWTSVGDRARRRPAGARPGLHGAGVPRW